MSRSICPHCGAPLKPSAVACRECGSDVETGWSDDVDYLSVELPEDPPERDPRHRTRTIAVICVVVMLAGSGVTYLLGVKNLATLILILAFLLPMLLGMRPGDGDGRARR